MMGTTLSDRAAVSNEGKTDQLLRERSYPIGVIAKPPKVHPYVAAIGPTQARKRLRERRVARLRLRIIFIERHEHADPPHAVALLRARRDRQCRRAGKRDDEIAPFHSMISVARA
jgi:hypothetical protein